MNIHIKANSVTIVCLLVVFVTGCSSYGVAPSSDPIDVFESKVNSREFHEAFLYWPDVEPKYEAIAEGAVGLAYDRLVGRTAAVGTNDWVAIFIDNKIDDSHKRALFEEIITGDEWKTRPE